MINNFDEKSCDKKVCQFNGYHKQLTVLYTNTYNFILRTIIKLYFSVLRLLFNIIILLTALKRLPELRGYRGRRYPGQLPPSKPTLLPRRLNLPPDYQWQNIGSRRTKFLDLGMPTFGRPRKIIVKPLLHVNNEDMDEC